jgi:hypothetical protein
VRQRGVVLDEDGDRRGDHERPDERRDLELASSMPASGTVSRPNEAELVLETLQERIAE